MTSLISPQNPVANLLGYSSFLEWDYCVFERSLIIEDGETEDRYIERIAYTLEGINAQIEYLDNDMSFKYFTATEKMTFMKRLDERKKVIVDLLEFDPTGEIEDLTFSNETANENDEVRLSEFIADNTTPKQSIKRSFAPKKHHIVVAQYLKLFPEAGINDVWRFFANHVGEEIFDLIEITKVTDLTAKDAELYWLDAKTGKEGKPIQRQRVQNIMSEIRTKKRKID
ncbi:MAG: hypothetical protein ACSHW0_15870 [Thalassotalea sp.]